MVEDDVAVEAFAQGKTAPLVLESILALRQKLGVDEYKILRTQIMYAGHTRDTRHVAIINSSQTVATIASPVPDGSGLYKPDKVLFLNP